MSKYSSFDDMLEKMKSIGDPDELDDETFRTMFMGGRLKPSEKSDIDDDYVLYSSGHIAHEAAPAAVIVVIAHSRISFQCLQPRPAL